MARIVNRVKSKVVSRVEHVFAMAKRQCGFNEVRRKGLAKDAARAFAAGTSIRSAWIERA